MATDKTNETSPHGIDNGVYMYAAPELDPFPDPPHQPSLDGIATVTWTMAIPPRTFAWNTPEYWAWWRGYIACNAVTAHQMLDAIEEDRRAIERAPQSP